MTLNLIANSKKSVTFTEMLLQVQQTDNCLCLCGKLVCIAQMDEDNVLLMYKYDNSVDTNTPLHRTVNIFAPVLGTFHSGCLLFFRNTCVKKHGRCRSKKVSEYTAVAFCLLI